MREPRVESLALLDLICIFSEWKIAHEYMTLLVLASVVCAGAERQGQAFMMHAREDCATSLLYPRWHERGLFPIAAALEQFLAVSLESSA